jgi:exopolysaccharide production protein ExoQ
MSLQSRAFAPPSTDHEMAPSGPLRTDLWRGLAGLTLGFALLKGLGAFDLLFGISPTKYWISLTLLLGLTLLFTPRGLMKEVRFPTPLVLLMGWIVLSYAWTSYRPLFIKFVLPDLVTITTVVVVGQLLSVDRYLRVLLRSGYVAMGLIFFAVATKFSLAYNSEGLRGGFIHKNPMGAALVLTVAAALCIETRPTVRRALIIVVVILLLLGHTTTGMASMLLLLSVYVVMLHYKELHETLGRAFGGLMTGAVVIFGALYLVASDALIGLYGKDLTFSKRTVIWQGVQNAISHRPITGYGWSVWAALWRPPASDVIHSAGFVVAESHNTALELLLRVGVVGLVLYLWLFFRALRSGLSLAAQGDRAGIFAVLLTAIVVIWGFSEALPAYGVWIGLLGVAAIRRPISPVTTVPEVARSRLFAPKVVHAR